MFHSCSSVAKHPRPSCSCVRFGWSGYMYNSSEHRSLSSVMPMPCACPKRSRVPTIHVQKPKVEFLHVWLSSQAFVIKYSPFRYASIIITTQRCPPPSPQPNILLFRPLPLTPSNLFNTPLAPP
ncbi:hypothetical protein HBH56_101980 [Parastagonospora nodorum]|uniref:Uncharacterized protein n=1 Tax=Phaeosphaeria nodorum (strain SN15 / ATCC MYA-4574 / FGSC 10173) TaxID=321614 RepID=A0A7U2I879_PHANO|nr:hypothetical protein HBH56_101980 [Parastagonospora nodorum]QRD04492.1 hypothetical protein JI435_421370 [Parastagonospora nodorum SN15]KAH3929642.1 hypothetical protein HBH54_128430 [Parastagonospora nodorum]KAH3975716.1 hypothetical protein HBH52_124430 [Parastagonospora nodorum]KAH4137760.1 hypothetical protein HBH45_117380 [Parastagonospora nodorum]